MELIILLLFPTQSPAIRKRGGRGRDKSDRSVEKFHRRSRLFSPSAAGFSKEARDPVSNS